MFPIEKFANDLIPQLSTFGTITSNPSEQFNLSHQRHRAVAGQKFEYFDTRR